MGNTEAGASYPATSEEMTAVLNAALEAGDLERIMGIMGQMARAHRMRRVARETGLGEKNLYKSMRAGASHEFNTVLRVLRSLGFPIQVRQITLRLCQTKGTLRGTGIETQPLMRKSRVLKHHSSFFTFTSILESEVEPIIRTGSGLS